MKFYHNKFKELRTRKKFQIKELAEKTGLNRSTLWLWETGKIQPAEKKIRELAKILDISPDTISDLQPELPISDEEMGKHKKIISSWISLTDTDLQNRGKNQEWHLNILKEQLKESNQVISIFRALINFSDAMLYVKDANQKYIAASKAFLNLVSLEEERQIMGKIDSDIFPKHEAKENLEEDETAIKTGKTVKNREALIPGSRKQRWGLISKVPTFDSDGKITGIIGSFIDITKRKHDELLIEDFKNGMRMIDETIWMAKKAKERPEGGITFDQFLYAIDDSFKRKFFIEENNLPLKELWDYGYSLIIDNDKGGKLKLDELIKNKKTEARYKLKLPLNPKILYIKNKFYYDPASELFVGVTTEDTGTERIEKIVEKLRRCGVKEKIIKEAFADDNN